MGERSQIFVRYETEDGTKDVLAFHLQWCYGSRLVSRAVYALSWLKNYAQNLYKGSVAKEFKTLLSVNFDYDDVDSIAVDLVDESMKWEADKFNVGLFTGQDNDDGCLFLDVDYDGNTKYCFISNEEYYGEKVPEPLTAEQYMNSKEWFWEIAEGEYLKTDVLTEQEYLDLKGFKTTADITKVNIKNLETLGKVMTKEELIEFITCPYLENSTRENNVKAIKKEWKDIDE